MIILYSGSVPQLRLMISAHPVVPFSFRFGCVASQYHLNS